MKTAFFRFYAELNDFLTRNIRGKEFPYEFWGNPAIKDAIEALGVPHPEVDLILVNGRSVDFAYRLQNGDRVSVYPVFELLDIADVTRLRPKPLREPRFIADVNLGKLARKLRLLGFDTLYKNDYDDKTIIRIAVKEHRIILTRDIELLKHHLVSHGYWLRSTIPEKQTMEIVDKFDLYRQVKAFSRCTECNGILKAAAKSDVAHLIKQQTKKHFDRFFQCEQCKKVYWPGTHYKRMALFVTTILNKQQKPHSGY